MGSGNIVTETRAVSNFNEIVVGSAFEVEIKNGPVAEVSVEADDNVINSIETKVKGDKLKINIKSGRSFNNAHYKVYVTAPQINSLHISGAASVKTINQLKAADKIEIDLSGAANFTASLDAPEIDAEVSGAGNITLKGRTRNYTAKVSGSGKIESYDLLSENTTVNVSGAGTAKVYASVSLQADASGAGNVFYKGLGNVNQKTSGAANIKSAN